MLSKPAEFCQADKSGSGERVGGKLSLGFLLLSFPSLCCTARSPQVRPSDKETSQFVSNFLLSVSSQARWRQLILMRVFIPKALFC